MSWPCTPSDPPLTSAASDIARVRRTYNISVCSFPGGYAGCMPAYPLGRLPSSCQNLFSSYIRLLTYPGWPDVHHSEPRSRQAGRAQEVTVNTEGGLGAHIVRTVHILISV